MTKIQSDTEFNSDEELVFSIIASIARLGRKNNFFWSLGRFRGFSNPFRFHEQNIKTVMRMTSSLIIKDGLVQFLLDAQEIIDNKKDAL